MGKCFSCIKSTSFRNSREQNISPDCVKEDIIISTKEENTSSMPSNNSQQLLQQQQQQQCSVPHLQTVLFKRNDNNGSTCTLSRGCGEIKSNANNSSGGGGQSSRSSFYPRLTSLIKSNIGDKAVAIKSVSGSKIVAMYNCYKDASEENYILADGIEKLCTDLNLLPEDFKVLLLAWQFNACQMCQFSKSEFVDGCLRLNGNSVKGLQERLSEVAVKVETDKELFKQLYRYTFGFGLDNNQGQRILPTDIAISLWKLVFTVHAPPILPRWLNFLVEMPHIRGIPRDTWNMFLNFSEYVGNNLSSYDDSEAWPSIFDEFVEYENDERRIIDY